MNWKELLWGKYEYRNVKEDVGDQYNQNIKLGVKVGLIPSMIILGGIVWAIFFR